MDAESDVPHAVALGGFMGAGKSTVGRELSRSLGWDFVDTDTEVSRRHGPVAEQIARDGEGAFRRREAEVVRELAARASRVVIATGGGVFADHELRQALSEVGATVTLDVGLDVVWQRVGGDPGRPLLDQAEALLAARQDAYRDVDLIVDGTPPVEGVAARIQHWLGVARDVSVELGARAYSVQLRDRVDTVGQAVARAGLARVVVLTDDTVGPLWAEPVEASLRQAGVRVLGRHAQPAGEAHKTLGTWSDALSVALELGLDRGTAIVALGGGVVGDVAGFVAASALRGVPLVQVPTTVLAMVDSSVGGKTGVNHASGKNRVGAFHQPRVVVAPLETLSTLDPRAARSGLAEAVKAALVGDVELLEIMEERAEALAALDTEALAAVLGRAIRVKARIVVADEREAGRRAVLNLGHTVGHALEATLGFGRLHHGEAVGVGLWVEAAWAEAVGLGQDGLSGRIQRLLGRLGLPVHPPVLPARDALLTALRLDKKRGGAMLTVPVCVRPGDVRLHRLALSGESSPAPEGLQRADALFDSLFLPDTSRGPR